MKRIILTLLPMALLTLSGCNTPKPGQIAAPPFETGPGTTAAVPDAIVYQMNGDYAAYVPVTLNADRTAIVNWPAPTDITEASTPIKLAGGWYLDRRGINPNSGFLRYTYKEYSKLPASTGPAELIDKLIPEARITSIRRLPIKLWQAAENPVEASKLVDNSPVIYP